MEKHNKTKRWLPSDIKRMRETLELIKRGLAQGSIRSKPIMEFDPDAEQCPVRALEDIVDEALGLR